MAKGAAAAAALSGGAGAAAPAAGAGLAAAAPAAATIAPAAAGAAAPAAAGVLGTGAGAGALTGGAAAPSALGTAAGAAPAATGSGLGAWMLSPTGKAVSSIASGILSAASPEAARGIGAARGTYGMLEGISDRGSVAGAVSNYTNVAKKDLADRGIDQVVREGGRTDPESLYEGGPFVMGGAGSGDAMDASSAALMEHGALLDTLPATARANPSQAGYLIGNVAKSSPSAPGPTLYETVDRFGEMQAGLPAGVGMQQTHTGPFGIKTVLQARQPPATVEEEEEAGVTQAEIDAIRGDLKAGESASVLGPHGAKRSLVGPKQPGGPVAEALPFMSPSGGEGWVLNKRTGKWEPPPPGYGQEAATYVVVADPSAPGGFKVVPQSSRR